MGLSCGYGEDDYEWWYYEPEDFELLGTLRGRRCFSCKCAIKVGDTCARFESWRAPRSDVEERIYGDHVPRADKYLCEECGGLFFALHELGYNISLDGQSMRELVEEHNEIQKYNRMHEANWQKHFGQPAGVSA